MMMRAALIVSVLALAAGCATTGETPREVEAKPGRTAAAPKPAFVRSDLMGREAKALDDLLGAPGLVRREGEGEFRRYALSGCALIVILYPNDRGKRAAAHLDSAAMRSGDPKPDLDACLAKGRAG